MSPKGKRSEGSPIDPQPSGALQAPTTKGEGLTEFLNPKSMITPGLAGALTMAIASTVCTNFCIDEKPFRALVALAIAALFVVLPVGIAVMPLWQKAVYFLLNTLIVFQMAFGMNLTGDKVEKLINKDKEVYPSGVFEKTSSLSIFTTEAFAQEYIDGVLLKGGEDPPVYIVIGGQRRWIPDEKTFYTLGLNPNAIKIINKEKLKTIPRGPDYPSLPGSIVKGSGPAVYLLEKGYRRLVPDQQTFEALGLRGDSIRVIPDQALQLIPEASAVPKKRRFFTPWF